MGKIYDSIDGRLRDFIVSQPMFFVATAASDGRVNLSPKGLRGTFAVLGEQRVAYVDYYGSGVETIAHLRADGRITIMFCAFEGRPNIVRLYGQGEPVLPEDPGFAELKPAFDPPEWHGVRSIITVAVDRVSDSCGYSVPLMDYAGDRGILQQSHARRSEEDLAEYRKTRNASSIDGLPGL